MVSSTSGWGVPLWSLRLQNPCTANLISQLKAPGPLARGTNCWNMLKRETTVQRLCNQYRSVCHATTLLAVPWSLLIRCLLFRYRYGKRANRKRDLSLAESKKGPECQPFFARTQRYAIICHQEQLRFLERSKGTLSPSPKTSILGKCKTASPDARWERLPSTEQT